MLPAAAAVCPECSHAFVAAPREIERRDGSLVELDPDRLRQIRTTPLPALLTQAKTRADLRQIQVAKGYKSGWAFYAAKERGIYR